MPGVAPATAAATISQYVLKVHSRCDLACDHCYVYEHADKSWRGKPRAISPRTADQAARRIAEHARAHALPRVRVVLHGGEPLLLGRDATRTLLDTLTARIAPVTGLDLSVHTNGVRLDEQWCELFGEYGVRVGISLDGDLAANDRHRRYADGRSSHAQVLRTLEMLRRPRYRSLYSGILCTVDVANDPEAVYRALIAERPPRLDLLLPHGTWDNPPPRPGGLPHPYADWLLVVYRCWIEDGRPVPIRLFDSVLSAVRGGPSFSEAIGLDPVDLLVIDTDGAWEQVDSLKTAFHGAAGTGMGVWSHPVDQAARHPGVVARLGGLAPLCDTCRACPIVGVCGGGLYPHRYRTGTEFANPSVYCPDLKELIVNLAASAPRATVTGSQPEPRPVHQLPPGAFEALAAGPGTVAAVEALAQLRLSQTRALVAAIAAAASAPGRGAGRTAALAAATVEGWSLLCALDATHPDAVAAVLGHPYVRVWALRCLDPPEGADSDLDGAHLAGLAAAAALRAGVAAELPVPVRDGFVHLPSLGALGQASAADVARVVIKPDGGGLAVDGASGWLSVRQVSSTPVPIAVEDLDPFRDCQQWPVTGRLTVPHWLDWRAALAAAGRQIQRTVPDYAAVLAAGLRAVVPLLPADDGVRSATSRHAFGAVALTLAVRGTAVEDMIVHEFQHAKLFALSDLYRLVDTGSGQRLRVPWRTDPRPPDGVLHGIYAHLALAQLSLARGDAGRGAAQRYRTWVLGACQGLYETKALTPDGERFVAGMLGAVQDRVRYGG